MRCIFLIFALAAIAHTAPMSYSEQAAAAAEAFFQEQLLKAQEQNLERSFTQKKEDDSPKSSGKSDSKGSGDLELDNLLKDIQDKINQLPESKGVITKDELLLIAEADQALKLYSKEKKITGIDISFPAPSDPSEQEDLAKALEKYKNKMDKELNTLDDDTDPITVAIKDVDKALLLIAKVRDLKGVNIEVSTESA